jgi:hypothetical protein
MSTSGGKTFGDSATKFARSADDDGNATFE